MIFGFLLILSIGYSQTKQTHTYGVKDGEELKLDIYFPDNFDQNTSFPTIVWMHGGGFSGGSRDAPDETQLCQEITNRNYIAVSISYRLTRKGTKEGFGCDCPKEVKLETFQKASEDYLDAVQFLIRNRGKFKIDPEKVIAGGSSAGAEGILNAIFMKENWFDSKYEDVNFAGLISLAGAAVPEIKIDKINSIPAVFFHGAEDKTVPYETNPHHFCEKNKAGYLVLKGSRSIVEEYENLNQSYFLFTSLNGKHEWSGIPFEYLNQIFEFLRLTLEKKKFLTIEINID
ncbi:alpha/beta hydrolase [Moheibacter lacus]|nr:alpha/beta hydrolase [Moheibacter lacus]